MNLDRIFVGYDVDNRLLNFLRSRDIRIADAEIEHILCAIFVGHLFTFFKHGSDHRVVVYQRLHSL